jgi:two-component system cell cycle response regulator
MTARVLVVDDIVANVKLLEARLRAEYFEVMTASSGFEALEICARESADLVLLDVMMPGLDGFEVCRRLKADPKTQNIPVVMVTALDQPSDRIQGFEAGADDFLTKPVNDVALITRVKNLTRMKQMTDELVMRVIKSDQGAGSADLIIQLGATGRDGEVLLVDDQPVAAQRLQEVLNTEQSVHLATEEAQVFDVLEKNDIDLAVINLSMEKMDALRLCSIIRSHNETRHLPLLVLGEAGDEARMLRALDLGVNDYVERPVDRNELVVRIRTQVKRRRYAEYLYRRLDERVEQASRDPLTGMYNRRHMEEHLDVMIKEAQKAGRDLSVILADIDHFKSVNDNYGHDSGDQVIRQFSTRVHQNIRRADLAFRIGGEEFLIVLPKTNQKKAEIVAERLRAVIENTPFRISDEIGSIKVTSSMGVTKMIPKDTRNEEMLKRADEALYDAKNSGRNRIVSRAA